MKKTIGTLFASLVLALVGLFALAGPASAKPVPGEVTVAIDDSTCGQATFTLGNTTDYYFGAAYNSSSGESGTISVDGREGGDAEDFKSVTVEFPEDSGDVNVTFGVFEGAERDNYPAPVEATIDTNCLPEPTEDPTSTPTDDPTEEPTDDPTRDPTGSPSPSTSPAPGSGGSGGSGGDSGGLPVTGPSAPTLAGLAGLLIASGSGALWLARRRLAPTAS